VLYVALASLAFTDAEAPLRRRNLIFSAAAEKKFLPACLPALFFYFVLYQKPPYGG
jgi:hypothetical protein